MRFLSPKNLSNPLDAEHISDVPLFRIDPSQKIISAKQLTVFLKAKNIIKKAKEEEHRIQEKIQEAFAKEKERGYKEGVSTAKLDQSRHMIEQVSRSVDYFETVEKRVVDIVLSAVRKIIYEFSDRDLTVAIVKNAMSAVRSQKQVVIKVNPKNVEPLQQSINDILKEFPSVSFLDVSSDSRIPYDACVLESEIGIIEMNVSEQLDALQKIFTRVLGRSSSSAYTSS